MNIRRNKSARYGIIEYNASGKVVRTIPPIPPCNQWMEYYPSDINTNPHGIDISDMLQHEEC